MTEERRLAKRYPIGIDATLITPKASIPVHALDICAGGIRIESPEPVPPELNIALSLATEEETLLSGSILWTLEIKSEAGTPLYEIGIEADAFILRDQEAIGFADKVMLVSEILARVPQTTFQKESDRLV